MLEVYAAYRDGSGSTVTDEVEKATAGRPGRSPTSCTTTQQLSDGLGVPAGGVAGEHRSQPSEVGRDQ